ncbi:unnamed protein product [Protopolystoma xenopodis]|uniref:Uncharacterized protein n=1 Tax=Protopolystoma xenopodis TaxID=117903 RepID=A0A448WJ11_9PLAT|nr:unnamed protein product [Protopolystoma xenopodis]
MLQEERAVLEAQRRRHLDEVSAERDRLAQTAARQRTEFDDKLSEQTEALRRLSEDHRKEVERIRQELEDKHKSEITAIEAKTASEKAACEERITTVWQTQASSRERELREHLKRERDKQLEIAVHKTYFMSI